MGIHLAFENVANMQQASAITAQNHGNVSVMCKPMLHKNHNAPAKVSNVTHMLQVTRGVRLIL